MTETIGDIDTFDLIVMMGMDESHCEVNPEQHAKYAPECGKSVHYRLIARCRGAALCCKQYGIARWNAVDSIKPCAYNCGKTQGECWDILPV